MKYIFFKTTLVTSEVDSDKTTLVTSEVDSDKTTLETSEVDSDKTIFEESEWNVHKTTLETIAQAYLAVYKHFTGDRIVKPNP